jgi:hypothetical protein
VVPHRNPAVTSPMAARAARYRWAVALNIPIAAETFAADMGFSDSRNVCSTSCLVEEAAMVGGRGGGSWGAAHREPRPRDVGSRTLPLRSTSAASPREVHQGGTDARVELLVSAQIQL